MRTNNTAAQATTAKPATTTPAKTAKGTTTKTKGALPATAPCQLWLDAELSKRAADEARKRGITPDAVWELAMRALLTKEAETQVEIPLPLTLQARAKRIARKNGMPLTSLYRLAILKTVEGLEAGTLTVQGPG